VRRKYTHTYVHACVGVFSTQQNSCEGFLNCCVSLPGGGVGGKATAEAELADRRLLLCFPLSLLVVQ
jgi:hypothetical protein